MADEVFDDFSSDSVRVEVFTERLSLMLKKSDLSIERLARVFKLVPSTIYLEEDVTNHVEFPTDGKFNVPFGKYRIYGDDASECRTPEPRPSTSSWAITRPWSVAGSSSVLAGVRSKRGSVSGTQSRYETFWKRSIPLVALCLDDNCRNILVDSTVNNVYVKVPENSLSVGSIISAVATKVNIAFEDLVLLDSKLIEVADDKDIEFWRTPSRKLYIARRCEYADVIKVKARKKVPGGKRPHSEEAEGITKLLETKIAKIDSDLTKYIGDAEDVKKFKNTKEAALKVLECKICGQLPTGRVVLILCCNQILGCQPCYNRAMEEKEECPLCRGPTPISAILNGVEPLYSFFGQT